MRRRAIVVLLIGLLIVAAGCTDSSGPEPLPAPSGLQWRDLTPAPSARTEVAAAAVGPLIYVVGGYTADGATVPTLEVFDSGSGRWEVGPPLPVAVNHAMAATVDEAVYVFGGYLASGAPSASAYRLESSGWRLLAELPQGRAAGTAVAVGGSVYVAGGIGPDGLATQMLVYDTAAGRWSVAPGPTTSREHLGGAGFGGRVYTVGGRAAGVGNLSAFEVYDPGTGSWTTLPDLPTRRGGLAAAATCSGQVIAVGGEAEATFEEVEAFDVASGAWRTLPPSPTPRHGLGVVTIGTVLYTLSGGPQPGLHVSGAVESMDLASLGRCP